METELLPRLRKPKVSLAKPSGRALTDQQSEGLARSESFRSDSKKLHRKGFTGQLEVKTGSSEPDEPIKAQYANDDKLRSGLKKTNSQGQKYQSRSDSAGNPWVPKLTFGNLVAAGDENESKQRLDDLSYRSNEVSRLEKKNSAMNRMTARLHPSNVDRYSSAGLTEFNAARVSYAGEGLSYQVRKVYGRHNVDISILGKLEGHQFSRLDWCCPQEIDVPQDVMEALNTPGKDRLYSELNVIIGFLDSLSAEPFASMNEFEKLKCASICTLESCSHGDVVLDFGEQPEKLQLVLQGSVTVFNFSEAMDKFEEEKELEFKSFQSHARSTGISPAEFQRGIKTFQQQWLSKFESRFCSSFAALQGHESGELPVGTKCWTLTAGAVFGGDARSQDDTGSRSTRMICSAGPNQVARFLSLSRPQVEAISNLGNFRYHEKAQILRSSKCFTGVSKLTIKMLAMQIQEQTIGPNAVVVGQGAVPTNLFVVKRGFLRIVRKLAQGNGNSGSLASVKGSSSHRQSGEIVSKSIPENMPGQCVEIGLIGPTHFFGAVSILEHGHINPSPVHLISCSVIDVLMLSRQDIGKVSYEDREIMLANARRLEVTTEADWQIVEKLKKEKQWSSFKATLLKEVVDANSYKKKQVANVPSPYCSSY